MADKTFEWSDPATKLPKVGEAIIVELIPQLGYPADYKIRFEAQYVNVFSDHATFNHSNYFFNTNQTDEEKTWPVDQVRQWSPWFEGWENAVESDLAPAKAKRTNKK
ncbi:hypothetical protein MA9V2_009 [Chryseobacterium phage MA9V-2]|nr:hypothetical protein MA9V2_009 [Chryseobacterium phage MA9V-2]